MQTRTSGLRGECQRYICLAEYRCKCRPAGSPVSRNTMLRHRKAANLRRRELGLTDLPWGPIFTEHSSREIYLRYRSLTTQENAYIETYSFSYPTSNTPFDQDTGMDLQIHTGEPLQLSESVNACDTAQTRATPDANNTQQLNSFHLPSEPPSPHDCDVLSLPVSSESDLGVDQGNTPEGSVFEHIHEDPANVAEHEISVGLRGNARTFLAFKAWAMQNRKWVETCIDFAVTGALFDRILQNIDAPFTAVTVKRNFVKYANFTTYKYTSCRPHMLISSDDGEEMLEESTVQNAICDVCTAAGTAPELTTFEYLPLQPRILAWFRNERNYRDITEYRNLKLQDRRSGESPSSGRVYEDYFDGEWFHRIAAKYGGIEAVKNDLFLSISTDGFQTYENQSYNCWPILALNNNLHPSKRFILKNIIPLAYIKGPDEPHRLDTFFIPLVNELKLINSDGGMDVTLPDGSTTKIRVHILWISCDKQAKSKIAGLAGQNSKTPCDECNIQGVWCPSCRHYYFPSKIIQSTSTDGSRRFEVLFDIEQLPMRSVESIEAIWEQFTSEPALTKSGQQTLIRETGIKPRTALYDIESVVPFSSFPHDSMHHVMNVSKDILELLKGENKRAPTTRWLLFKRCFVISESGWRMIDAEIEKVCYGTSLASFGPAPRTTASYRNYKAAEWKEFFSSFALVLFEGHLPRVYMKGLRHFCLIVDLCRRPVVTSQDPDDLGRSAKAFYKHMEECYFRYDRRRLGIMKSTLHSLLHLRGQVVRYGPFTNYNQFWVERRIGDEKSKLYATIRAAESMTERAKLVESFKIFYDDHFSSSNTDREEMMIDQDSDSSSFAARPLLRCTQACFTDPIYRSYGGKDLLRSYLLRRGVLPQDIEKQVAGNKLLVYGQLQMPCGETFMTVGAMKSRRYRACMKRSDWYVQRSSNTRVIQVSGLFTTGEFCR